MPDETPSTPATTTAASEPKQTKAEALGITLVDAEFESLGGLKIKLGVPSSVTDYDKLAGKDGATLADAIKNTVYRGPLAVFRDKFCTALEAKSGIERAFKPELDDKGQPKVDKDGSAIGSYTESEARYVKRVAGDNVAQYQSLADEISASLVFDPSARDPKTSGPKKLAKMYTEAAQSLFDQGRGADVVEKLNTKLGTTFPATVEGLALAIKEDQNKKSLAAEYAS
jgi:hypothetical protein